MDLIVTLSCVDQPGIVHAMTTSVLSCGGNITENQQFTDPFLILILRKKHESLALREPDRCRSSGMD